MSALQNFESVLMEGYVKMGGECPARTSCIVVRRLSPCFVAVAKRLLMLQKTYAPFSVRKPPEIFCLSFIILTSLSARLLENGTL